jgi:hypothetical protein
MHIERRVARAWMSALCLGMLLGVAIVPLPAADRAAPFIGKRSAPVGSVPQAGALPYAPPAFIDRGSPISERPFATPFVDRSSPISERPLAPIGGGLQVAPDSIPFIWCHGVWVRVDRPGQSCTSH